VLQCLIALADIILKTQLSMRYILPNDERIGLVEKSQPESDDDILRHLSSLEPNKMLVHASEMGFLKAVGFALDAGADISFDNNFAVRVAARKGHLEIVKFLFEKGADITANSNHAIQLAALKGCLAVVKYLFEKGADITAWDDAAFRFAAQNGHLKVVRFLCENGADITALNNYAIRLAAKEGHLKVVKYLLSIESLADKLPAEQLFEYKEMVG
jgi:ankyrin repeat protein